MKPYAIIVPGSCITKQTAPDYLRRIARRLLENPTMESTFVLDEIETRIVKAGFLTWEQAEQIEAEATAAKKNRVDPCASCSDREKSRWGACNNGLGICSACMEYHRA